MSSDAKLMVLRRNQTVQKQNDQKISNHGLEIEPANSLFPLIENDSPDQNCPHQGQQLKDRPQKEIPTINKGILKPDIECLQINLRIPMHPLEGVQEFKEFQEFSMTPLYVYIQLRSIAGD